MAAQAHVLSKLTDAGFLFVCLFCSVLTIESNKFFFYSSPGFLGGDYLKGKGGFFFPDTDEG